MSKDIQRLRQRIAGKLSTMSQPTPGVVTNTDINRIASANTATSTSAVAANTAVSGDAGTAVQPPLQGRVATAIDDLRKQIAMKWGHSHSSASHYKTVTVDFDRHPSTSHRLTFYPPRSHVIHVTVPDTAMRRAPVPTAPQVSVHVHYDAPNAAPAVVPATPDTNTVNVRVHGAGACGCTGGGCKSPCSSRSRAEVHTLRVHGTLPRQQLLKDNEQEVADFSHLRAADPFSNMQADDLRDPDTPINTP